MEYEKVYVAVLLRVSKEGKITPASIEWENGRSYEITKVKNERLAPPSYVGGIMIAVYDCVIEGQMKTLFREEDTGRWFVERPLA